MWRSAKRGVWVLLAVFLCVGAVSGCQSFGATPSSQSDEGRAKTVQQWIGRKQPGW